MSPSLFLLVLASGAVSAAEIDVIGRDQKLYVYVDGKLHGTTPVTLDLPDGSYTIILKQSTTSHAFLAQDLEIRGHESGMLVVNWGQEQLAFEWGDEFATSTRRPAPAPAADDLEEEDILLQEIGPIQTPDKAPRREVFEEDLEEDFDFEDLDAPDPAPRKATRTREPVPPPKTPSRADTTRFNSEDDLLEELDLEPAPTRTSAASAPTRSASEDAQIQAAVQDLLVQAAAFARNGDLDNALATLQVARDIDPDHPKVTALYERLEDERASQGRQSEATRRAEDARRAEEERRAEEARRREEARRADQERRAEEARRKEEARRAEEERRAEEARRKEEERRALARLATLRISVSGVDWTAPPTFQLATDDGSRYDPIQADARGLVFEKLPPEVPYTLRVTGPGYVTLDQPVGVLSPGARGTATVEVNHPGAARLEVAQWIKGASVWVRDQNDRQAVLKAGTLVLCAGKVEVEVEAPTGSRKTSLDLVAGATEVLRVADLVPAHVNLRGIPSGSTVTYVSGPEAWRAVPVSREAVGTEQMGVLVARNVPLPDLKAGPYVVEVSHPVLGLVRTSVEAKAGEATDHQVPWEQMSGAPQVVRAYQDWQARVAESEKTPPAAKLGMVGGAVTAGLVGVTGFLAVRAMGFGAEYSDLDAEYQAALAEDRGEDAWNAFARLDNIRTDRQSAWSLAGAGAAVSAGGAGFTLFSFGKAKRQRFTVPPWDLYALDDLLADDEEATDAN